MAPAQMREVRAPFEALIHVVEVRALSAQDGDREPLLKEGVELADLHGARVVKIPGGTNHQAQPTPLILHNDSLVGFGVLPCQLLPPELPRQLLPPELPGHGVHLLLARLEERDPYHSPMVPDGRPGVTQRVICFGLFAVLVDGDTRAHASRAPFLCRSRRRGQHRCVVCP
jgi:hypothetical protein